MADISKVITPSGDEYNLKDATARAASATMTGATAQSAGTGGTVPIPPAGDQDKFLRADGTWADGGHPMVVLTYGTSTWQEFIDAYNGHYIVYCRTGGRMAFMAYVNKDGVNPTEVEFQYYRSVSSKSDTQQGDETYIYKLTNANGGTWSTTTRQNYTRVIAGTNLSSTYSSQKITLNLDVNNETAAAGGTTLSLVTTGEKDTWNNKASTSTATTSAAGLMSSEDKTKLDGIAEGATANIGTITGITMNGVSKGTSGVVDLGTVITSHQDISGKVSGPSSATNNAVAIFDGTDGKTIKDSGFTIGKSVPSDAVFTDTTYTSKAASAGGTEVSLVTTGEKAIWNNKVDSSDVGVSVASLTSGKVPNSQIPDSVHDVLEYSSSSSFPAAGEEGKLYVDQSSNLTYRWDETEYVQVGGSSVPVMTGATSSTDGATGTVPAPLIADRSKYLKGDGTWAYVPATPPPPDFMGATAQMAGSSGLVPAPARGEQNAILLGNGSWGNSTVDFEVSNSISLDRKPNTTVGVGSSAVGHYTEASGTGSHAEGDESIASGSASHAEGNESTASGNYSHAEGNLTIASGMASHAEGTALSRYDPSTQTTTSYSTEASGTASHAEGIASTAYGNYSHSEGSETAASGVASHAEGSVTEAGGDYSHSEGMGTIAAARSQHVFGEYNTYESGASASNRGTYVEIIGNGTSSTRSNARTLDWSGNEWLAGDLVINGATNSPITVSSLTAGSKLLVVDLDTVTNTSGSYSHTTNVTGVTADMKPLKLDLGDPSIFRADVHITTGSGTVTLTCADVSGTSTVKVCLMLEASSSSITSAEYDVLSARIDNTVLMPSSSFTIPSSSISYNMPGLTENHILFKWNFSASPENVPPCDLSYETHDGYFTIVCDAGSSVETIQPIFILPKTVALTAHS